MYDDNDKYSDVKYNIKFSTMRKTWIELGINVFSSNFMNNLSKVIFFSKCGNITTHFFSQKEHFTHVFIFLLQLLSGMVLHIYWFTVSSGKRWADSRKLEG